MYVILVTGDMAELNGGMDQWLGLQSLAGGLFPTCTRSTIDRSFCHTVGKMTTMGQPTRQLSL